MLVMTTTLVHMIYWMLRYWPTMSIEVGDNARVHYRVEHSCICGTGMLYNAGWNFGGWQTVTFSQVWRCMRMLQAVFATRCCCRVVCGVFFNA